MDKHCVCVMFGILLSQCYIVLLPKNVDILTMQNIHSNIYIDFYVYNIWRTTGKLVTVKVGLRVLWFIQASLHWIKLDSSRGKTGHLQVLELLPFSEA